MVLHGSHQYTPFMLAYIYSIYGSYGLYRLLLWVIWILWVIDPIYIPAPWIRHGMDERNGTSGCFHDRMIALKTEALGLISLSQWRWYPSAMNIPRGRFFDGHISAFFCSLIFTNSLEDGIGRWHWYALIIWIFILIFMFFDLKGNWTPIWRSPLSVGLLKLLKSRRYRREAPPSLRPTSSHGLQGHQGSASARGLRASAALGSAWHVSDTQKPVAPEPRAHEAWALDLLRWLQIEDHEWFMPVSCQFHASFILSLFGFVWLSNSEVIRRPDTRAIPDLFWANQFLQSAKHLFLVPDTGCSLLSHRSGTKYFKHNLILFLILFQYWLVVWNIWIIVPYIGNKTSPFDELHHFSAG